MHIGECSYICKMCDRFFPQESALNVHQRAHTGERSYICHVRSKSVGDKSMLKSHQVVHTESVPLRVCVTNHSN